MPVETLAEISVNLGFVYREHGNSRVALIRSHMVICVCTEVGCGDGNASRSVNLLLEPARLFRTMQCDVVLNKTVAHL